jgi:hypothetical protein
MKVITETINDSILKLDSVYLTRYWNIEDLIKEVDDCVKIVDNIYRMIGI